MSPLRGPADADHFRVKVGRYGDRWYTDPLPSCPLAEAADFAAPSWSIVKGAAGKDWSFVANKRNANADTAELERIAKLEPTQRAQAFNAINKHGLNQAAGRGTIVHLWAEDMLNGKPPRDITDVDLMAMRLPKAALAEALTYRAALVDFFETYQPEMIAAEYVAIHRTLNGVGYGCTPDVVAVIQGQTLGIDWKSRGVDSDHGAYPEEAAQIAAGARAEYMIVADDDGGSRRAPLPQMDGGIVVSIKPDGCRIYPVDLDVAFRHVEAMHAFWVARRDEAKSIGKPWAPRTTVKAEVTIELTPAADRDALRARIAELVAAGHEDRVRAAWPHGVAPLSKPGHTDDDLALILTAVRRVESDVSWPFRPGDATVATPSRGEPCGTASSPTTPPTSSSPPPSASTLTALDSISTSSPTLNSTDSSRLPAEPGPTSDGHLVPNPDPEDMPPASPAVTDESPPRPAPQLPDEGGDVDPATVAALQAAFAALPEPARHAIGVISAEANAAGRPIQVSVQPTLRRWSIARALIRWADTNDVHPMTWQPYADHLWHAVGQILDSSQVTDDDTTLGALIGALTIEQANTLHDTFDITVAA